MFAGMVGTALTVNDTGEATPLTAAEMVSLPATVPSVYDTLALPSAPVTWTTSGAGSAVLRTPVGAPPLTTVIETGGGVMPTVATSNLPVGVEAEIVTDPREPIGFMMPPFTCASTAFDDVQAIGG